MRNYSDVVQATVDSMDILDGDVVYSDGCLALVTKTMIELPRRSKISAHLFYNNVKKQVRKALTKERDALTKIIEELE